MPSPSHGLSIFWPGSQLPSGAAAVEQGREEDAHTDYPTLVSHLVGRSPAEEQPFTWHFGGSAQERSSEGEEQVFQ